MKIDFLLYNYFTAIILIIVGIWRLRKIFRTEYDYQAKINPKLIIQGLFSSVILIVFGVMIIYGKIKGEL